MSSRMGPDDRDPMLNDLDGKQHFECREGVYKLIACQDYSLRNSYYSSLPGTPSNIPVRLSYSSSLLLASSSSSSVVRETTIPLTTEKLCCNLGKELYIYDVLHLPNNQMSEQVIPVDKRLYKETYPTCHDFSCGPTLPARPGPSVNDSASAPTTSPPQHSHVGTSNGGQDHDRAAYNSSVLSSTPGEPLSTSSPSAASASSSSSPPVTSTYRLLVGFTGGEILLMDLVNKEMSKLLYEELVDKSRVTCIQWVPPTSAHQPQQQFLVSHASGYLYLYSEHLPCGGTPPTFQLFKQGPTGSGFSVYVCKTKSTRNPLYRWQFGNHFQHHSQEPPSNTILSVRTPLPPPSSLNTVMENSRGGASITDGVVEHESLSTTDYASYSGDSLLSQRSGPHLSPHVGAPDSGSSGSSTTPAVSSTPHHATLQEVLLGKSQNWPSAMPTSIHQFAFSPCGQMLAVVTQDGYLRVFDYHQMELVGQMRSYFGGLLCVAWSPDSELVAVGGQDDLVTVWSVREGFVVCRCQAHKSWVAGVAFDPVNCFTSPVPQEANNNGLEPASPEVDSRPYSTSGRSSVHEGSSARLSGYMGRCYRLGSVGQDTQFCLWEITEDEIRQGYRFALQHQREQALVKSLSGVQVLPDPLSTSLGPHRGMSSGSKKASGATHNNQSQTLPHRHSSVLSSSGFMNHSLTQRLFRFNNNTTTTTNTQHSGNNASPPSSSSSGVGMGPPSVVSHSSATLGRFVDSLTYNATAHKSSNTSLNSEDLDSETKLLGTRLCPRLEDVPILSPIVCKQVSRDRLTELVFRRNCIVVACQQGIVYTWARPVVVPQVSSSSSCPRNAATANASSSILDPPTLTSMNNNYKVGAANSTSASSSTSTTKAPYSVKSTDWNGDPPPPSTSSQRYPTPATLLHPLPP